MRRFNEKTNTKSKINKNQINSQFISKDIHFHWVFIILFKCEPHYIRYNSLSRDKTKKNGESVYNTLDTNPIANVQCNVANKCASQPLYQIFCLQPLGKAFAHIIRRPCNYYCLCTAKHVKFVMRFQMVFFYKRCRLSLDTHEINFKWLLSMVRPPLCFLSTTFYIWYCLQRCDCW